MAIPTNFQCPTRLALESLEKVLIVCTDVVESRDDKVCIDLSQTTWIEPIGITLLAGTVYKSLNYNKEVYINEPREEKVIAFLSMIGFSELFGVDRLRLPKRQTSIRLRHLRGIDPVYLEGIIELLDSEMNLSEGVKDSINMSLNELIQNVFDHSKSDIGCFVCAQFIPKRQIILISVADWGIGILRSLQKKPEYKSLNNDVSAIRKAVEEGVSSRPGRAGLGLNHIKRFLKVNNGTLSIISGRGRANFYSRNIDDHTMRNGHSGVIVNMRIIANKKALYFMKNGEGKLF